MNTDDIIYDKIMVSSFSLVLLDLPLKKTYFTYAKKLLNYPSKYNGRVTTTAVANYRGPYV